MSIEIFTMLYSIQLTIVFLPYIITEFCVRYLNIREYEDEDEDEAKEEALKEIREIMKLKIDFRFIVKLVPGGLIIVIFDNIVRLLSSYIYKKLK